MAAPHVAGVASLIVGWNPTLNWSQVENILKNTAKPFGPGHTCTGTTTCGAGIVNAYAAFLDAKYDAGRSAEYAARG
jgi:serine protease